MSLMFSVRVSGLILALRLVQVIPESVLLERPFALVVTNSVLLLNGDEFIDWTGAANFLSSFQLLPLLSLFISSPIEVPARIISFFNGLM